MIDRPLAAARVHELFRSHPCVAILGPRQCGKTTLARMISAGETAVSFFDLESPVDARRLEAPLRTLGALEGLVIVDEIQRKPELFEILRVLVDRPDARSRFLILGSALPALKTACLDRSPARGSAGHRHPPSLVTVRQSIP